MKILSGSFLFLLCAMGIFAATEPATDTGRDIFHQTSTINALLAGYYDGILSCGELTQHGDTGLGTFAGLDGEMIVLDGIVYQVPLSGAVLAVPPTAMTPFANVTFFDPDETFELRDIESLAQLQKEIDRRLTNRSVFYAIRIDGVFNAVKTRSVPKQNKPYPRLTEAVKHQAVFDLKNVKGTLIGFWCPDFIQGLNVPGYHLHFLSEDRKSGGHVLDCRLTTGKVSLDLTPAFTMELPKQGFGRLDQGGNCAQELEAVEK